MDTYSTGKSMTIRYKIEETNARGSEGLALLNLGLDENDLRPHLAEMVRFKRLSLRRNNLTKLPAEIGDLINLELLDLSENSLTELPHEIGNLISLKYLNLAKNALTYLPQEIKKLSKLVDLILSENELLAFPEEIRELKNLEWLLIHGNVSLVRNMGDELLEEPLNAVSDALYLDKSRHTSNAKGILDYYFQNMHFGAVSR